MGQVKLPVTLRNARDVVMVRLGHLTPEQVHTLDVEARIDTGALRSVVPPAVADALGLVRLRRTEAQMVDGRWGEADVTEAVEVTLVAGVPRIHRSVHVLAWGYTRKELAQVRWDFQQHGWYVRWHHD
jgi:hypothetical protein